MSMSKKLYGNALWESSRMMLPEHKDAINEYNRSLQARSRTQLDEQEQETINRALQQSLQQHLPLSIGMYDPYEQLRIIGTVERLDGLRQRFMVDGEWFDLAQVEEVEQQ